MKRIHCRFIVIDITVTFFLYTTSFLLEPISDDILLGARWLSILCGNSKMAINPLW